MHAHDRKRVILAACHAIGVRAAICPRLLATLGTGWKIASIIGGRSGSSSCSWSNLVSERVKDSAGTPRRITLLSIENDAWRLKLGRTNKPKKLHRVNPRHVVASSATLATPAPGKNADKLNPNKTHASATIKPLVRLPSSIASNLLAMVAASSSVDSLPNIPTGSTTFSHQGNPTIPPVKPGS